MKRVKIIMAIAGVIAISLSALMITGCENYHDEEIGDFYVRFYSESEDCGIIGTTVQGNEQKFLVILEHINGVPLIYLGIKRTNIMGGDISLPTIESDTIEKVYFESDFSAHASSFYKCTNLKKIMFIKGKEWILNPGIEKFCYPYKIFKRDYSHVENCYNNGFYKIPANVSYDYNYSNAPNEGYFWIDDYDYGGKIEYIPKEPQREGYTFGGWYKEAECIKKWDFAADTLPELKTDIKENKEGVEEEMTIYQETILYAKWI